MKERINDILKNISNINEDALLDGNLFENEVLDSFSIVQLISALEEEFHVGIDPEDIIPENFSTVAAICRLIRK